MDILSEMRKEKVVAILRGFTQQEAITCVDTLYQGGIRFAEITFVQDGNLRQTADTIGTLREKFTDMYIGAGTVMTPEQVDLAHRAGAQYIISPDVNEAVIARTKELGLLSMPGALTPTEVAFAYRCGADVVKIFPAGNMGTAYFKSLCGPLGHIPMAAVGGISVQNFTDFLKAGAVCAGIGNQLGDLKRVRNGKLDELLEVARDFAGQAAAFSDKK